MPMLALTRGTYRGGVDDVEESLASARGVRRSLTRPRYITTTRIAKNTHMATPPSTEAAMIALFVMLWDAF